MEINLSNYSLNAFESGINTFEVHAYDLIKDFVIQIDKSIILALFFFGISYFLSLVFLPRAYKGVAFIGGFVSVPVFDVIVVHMKKLINFLIGFFETFCLGCCAFVLYLSWIQGLLLPYMKFIILGLLGVLIGIFLLKSYSYVINKKYKKTIHKLEVIHNG